MFNFDIMKCTLKMQKKLKEDSKVVMVPLGNTMIPVYSGAIEKKENKNERKSNKT